MADRRALLVPLALLVVVVGGSVLLDRSGKSSTDGNTSTGPRVTSSPTIAQGTVPETEWRAGLQRIIDLQNELYANPNPRRVSELMTADCPCYLDTVNRLTNLASKGERVSGANLVIREASLVGQPAGNEVLAYVKVGSLGKPTLDASGKTIRTSSAVDSVPLIYNLLKGNDGIWRLADRRQPEEQL